MNNTNKRTVALTLGIISFIIFGLSFMFIKSTLSYMEPFVMLSLRFVIAFIILNILILLKICKLDLKGKNIRGLLLLGLFQPILYFTFETFGLNLLSTSLTGTIVAIIPVMSTVLSIFFLKEKVSALAIAFAFITVFGVYLTTINTNSGQNSTIGLILIILAVFSASFFNIITKKTSVTFTAFERTYVMFLLGSIFFTLLAVVTTQGTYLSQVQSAFMTKKFYIDFFFLSSLSSVVAFFLINFAMTYLSVAEYSVFNNLSCVVSILAGVLILKEPFGIYQIVGSIIVVLSVCISSFISTKNKSKEKSL